MVMKQLACGSFHQYFNLGENSEIFLLRAFAGSLEPSIFPVELDYLLRAFPVSGRKFPFSSLMGSKF